MLLLPLSELTYLMKPVPDVSDNAHVMSVHIHNSVSNADMYGWNSGIVLILTFTNG